MSTSSKPVEQYPKPCGHRILVKPDAVGERTVGGIWKPDQARDLEKRASITGTIVALGPDCWYDKPSKWAKEGDRIVFVQYSSSLFWKGEPREVWFINDEDVLGTL